MAAQELTQDPRPFIFVFGHNPAYMVDNDTDDLNTSLEANPRQRDTFKLPRE